METAQLLKKVKKEIKELEKKLEEKKEFLKGLQQVYKTETDLTSRYETWKRTGEGMDSDTAELYEAIVEKDMIGWILKNT